MATLSRGITYGASETITNTKLHNLVDLGSISQIVNDDCSASMNLVDTKLLDITTVNKVRGTALGNLASIPSGAGIVPFANLPLPLGSTYCSLVSIPNASLVAITRASWVDGSAMRNIQSMPSLAGQLAWYSVSASLASGGSPIFNGVDKFVGGLSSSFQLVSRTSVSAAASSTDIPIDSTKQYFVRLVSTNSSSSESFSIRFNNSSGANTYGYVTRAFNFAATATNTNSATAATSIITGATSFAAGSAQANAYMDFYIGVQATGSTKNMYVRGTGWGAEGSGVTDGYMVDFAGVWKGTATATSFRIFLATQTYTGTIYLYEVAI